MSTKTSTSETNGLTRVWGFTDALFNLVGFHTKSQFSLMDHIQQFLQANNFSMRPLLEQVIIFFKKVAVKDCSTNGIKITISYFVKWNFLLMNVSFP